MLPRHRNHVKAILHRVIAMGQPFSAGHDGFDARLVRRHGRSVGMTDYGKQVADILDGFCRSQGNGVLDAETQFEVAITHF